jgi:hypothetical protein
MSMTSRSNDFHVQGKKIPPITPTVYKSLIFYKRIDGSDGEMRPISPCDYGYRQFMATAVPVDTIDAGIGSIALGKSTTGMADGAIIDFR